MQSASSVVRVTLGVVVGVLLIGLMPVYDEPFGGCRVQRFTALALGCSLWPDLILGLSVVLVVALIGGIRTKAIFLGMALVAVLAVLGGPSAIKSGMHLALWSQPGQMVYFWFGSGVAILLGGAIGSVLYLLLVRIFPEQNLKSET